MSKRHRHARRSGPFRPWYIYMRVSRPLSANTCRLIRSAGSILPENLFLHFSPAGKKAKVSDVVLKLGRELFVKV
jgi:hypothetical protein